MPVAFVTGATGMVGRNLADVLLENDWDVVCMVRDLSKLDRIPGGAKWVRGDLSDPQSLRRAVPGNTDCIFHCAANCSNWFRDRAQQLRENVGGTAALAGIARWGDMRMVFTSTGAINLLGQVWNQYADSKRQSEYQLKACDVVILRPGVIIGKYDWNNYSQLFRSIQQGKMRYALPGKMDICCARKVAEAHLKAVDAPGRDYTLYGDRVPWLHLWKEIAHATGGPPPKGVATRRQLLAVAYLSSVKALLTGGKAVFTPQLVRLLTAKAGADNRTMAYFDKLLLELGYFPSSSLAAVKNCCRWMLENEMLRTIKHV